MEEIGRKSLPHQLPWAIDPSRETFFLTICAKNRSMGPLLPVAPRLLDAIRVYQDLGKWWVHLAVVMPDHVHLLAGFPAEGGFAATVRYWKHWTTRHLGIEWQRDFFDHRLRREESVREKADYILQNPVRAGLVDDWHRWPHVWMPR
jgi:REP element-mobilizing transposase RayT